MAYAYDTKPSGSYTNDTKPTLFIGAGVGSPYGLLLTLTTGGVTGDSYTYDTKPT